MPLLLPAQAQGGAPLYDELQQAVEEGDLAGLEAALAAMTPDRQQMWQLEELLEFAVEEGRLACTDVLLQAGAPVSSYALGAAAAGGRAEALAMLLSAAGAVDFGALLRAAASRGSAKTVQVLLDAAAAAGAMVDAAALEAASGSAHPKPLQLLLQAANAADIVANWGSRLLCAAAAKGRSKNLQKQYSF